MSKLSVIVPSRTAANLVPCVEAVRKCEPDVQIIFVDDGVIAEYKDRCAHAMWWERAEPITRIYGDKPFIFARNCNLGIQAAGDDDVILLNDDAILESFAGFRLVQEAAMQHPEVGLISASTNVAGNPEQHNRKTGALRILSGKTPGNSFPTVAFVCVLIPRRTIEVVGLLDERFGGETAEGRRIYGWDDSDYCRRVNIAGLKIAVHDGCFVDHGKLKPTFRSEPFDMEAGRRIYMDKWKTI